MIKLEHKVIQKLLKHNQTVGLAESCTGGLVGHLLTNVAGSSGALTLGIIAYSNQAKCSILGIDKALIDAKGAVSRDVAQAMSEGIRRRAKSTYGVGITGIAGPSGGTTAKPVGLVYISLSTPTHTIVKKHLFTGTRLQIKKESARAALELLLN